MDLLPEELGLFERALQELPGPVPPPELRDLILGEAKGYLQAKRKRKESQLLVLAAACVLAVGAASIWAQKVGAPTRDFATGFVNRGTIEERMLHVGAASMDFTEEQL